MGNKRDVILPSHHDEKADFVGAANIILRSSSLETGENDLNGSPSNFISALMVSQLSLDELFVAAKIVPAKRDRRKAERRMRKSNLTVHREMFRDTCLKTNTLLLKCKKDYFSKKISEIEHDQLRVVQFHNIYNRSFTILGNFTIVQILNQVSCVDFTKFAVKHDVALFRRLCDLHSVTEQVPLVEQ
jgi:hypothetical protein